MVGAAPQVAIVRSLRSPGQLGRSGRVQLQPFSCFAQSSSASREVAKAPAGDSPAPPFLARGGLAYSWRMPGWSSKLTRPVVIKGGPLLRTLGDVRAFMIDHLPPEDQDRVSWQRTAELLLAAAEGSAEIEACTQQIERTLFLQAKWLLPRTSP